MGPVVEAKRERSRLVALALALAPGLGFAAPLPACERPSAPELAAPPPPASALAVPSSDRSALAEARPAPTAAPNAGAYEGRPIPEGEQVDRLVASKTAHRLEAHAGPRLLKTYRIAIGSGEKGPKRFEGDRKTPEGRYAIIGRHPSVRFHLFLEVSYPNDEDRAAHRAGLEDGSVPPGVGPGGAIGIHGERRKTPRAMNKARDWTAGCIAVDDDEIEELYRVVTDGASLEIRP